jgi:hypothetical protein
MRIAFCRSRFSQRRTPYIIAAQIIGERAQP